MKDEYFRRAIVKRWIDGDTVKLWVDLGFGVWHSATIQLAGVKLADTLTDEGRAAARDHLIGLAPKGSTVTVQTVRPRKDAAGQSFGRWPAKVWNVNGRNLSAVLVSNGYGVSSE